MSPQAAVRVNPSRAPRQGARVHRLTAATGHAIEGRPAAAPSHRRTVAHAGRRRPAAARRGLMPAGAQAAHPRYKASQLARLDHDDASRPGAPPGQRRRQVAIVAATPADHRRAHRRCPVLARTHDKGGRPWAPRPAARPHLRPHDAAPHRLDQRVAHAPLHDSVAPASSTSAPTASSSTSDGRRAAAASAAIVGKPSTPTPRGDFFVEENIRMLARLGRRARSRWPRAPAPTSSRSSTAAPARSPSTDSWASAAGSGPPSRTAACA